MKDSNINNNQKPLSEKEIKTSENFDDLMRRYQSAKPSLLKRNWYFLPIVVILVTLGVIFFNNSNTTTNNVVTYKENKKFKLQSPIPNADTKFDVFKFFSEEGTTLTTEKGSIIYIPKDAFVDANGNEVSGAINISFREFHDVAAIYASGIPMTYDSANTQYHFESAGMFEIKGEQNGLPVFINKKSPITVELASQQNGDYFNLYALDSNGVWNFIKKDTAKGIARIDSTVTEKDIEAAQKLLDKANKQFLKADNKLAKLIKKHIGYQPVAANNDLYSIKLNYQNDEFPELKPFKNLIFEVAEENEDFSPELVKRDWDDLRLAKDGNDYLLTFFDHREKFNFIVHPVVSGDQFSTAEKVFDNLFEQYDEQLNGKLSSEKRIRDSLKNRFRFIQDSVSGLNFSFASMSAQNSAINESTQKVMRAFTVENFGIFNSDCPQKLPKGTEFEPLFVNAKDRNDTLSFDHLYLAELSKNALFSLYGYWGKPKDNDVEEKYTSQPISFNSYNKTVMWGITSDNRFALVHPDDMPKLQPGGNLDVEMKIVNENIADINKLRKLLGFTG